VNQVLGLGLPPSAGGGEGFDPLSLSPHLWLDPSDLTTLFQERTGASATTPSVIDGVVGTMLDKSGNGLHVVAPTDAARPILRSAGGLYWLEFDGVDDVLSVASINLSTITIFLAARIVTYENFDVLLHGGNDKSRLWQVNTADQIRLDSGQVVTAAYTVGDDVVVTVYKEDAVGSSLQLDNASPGITDATGIDGGWSHFFVGGDTGASIFCNMLASQVVAFNRVVTAPEAASLRTYLAAKQGRVL
jgi:hypothetical protein